MQAYAPWVFCTHALCASGLRARSWYFLNGLLAVPQTGYLERGTLLFAAEAALPILGTAEKGKPQGGRHAEKERIVSLCACRGRPCGEWRHADIELDGTQGSRARGQERGDEDPARRQDAVVCGFFKREQHDGALRQCSRSWRQSRSAQGAAAVLCRARQVYLHRSAVQHG